MKSKFSILGAGSWGTVLANLLATNGHECLLHTRNQKVHDSISLKNINEVYHPKFRIHENVKITKNLQEFSSFSDIWVIAIPSKKIPFLMEDIDPKVLLKKEFIIASKGIDKKSFSTMSEVLKKEFAVNTKDTFVLSGPNLAKEVLEGQTSASVLAGDNLKRTEELSNFFNSSSFKVFISQDKKGVELSGSLKNIYAISAGLADGLGSKFNTKAMILTRSLHEMSELFRSLDANPETLLGLAGVGDLIATSSSSDSRNYSFGFNLGKGDDVETSLKKVNQVVEGINTLEMVFKKKNELNLIMPIIDILYRIIFEGGNAQDCFADILIEGDNIDS